LARGIKAKKKGIKQGVVFSTGPMPFLPKDSLETWDPTNAVKVKAVLILSLLLL
jgi:hypothetical protein